MLYLAAIVEEAKHIFKNYKGNLVRMLQKCSADSGGEATFRNDVFDCFVDKNRAKKIYEKSPNIDTTEYGGSFIPKFN